jgi:hypothetical protein
VLNERLVVEEKIQLYILKLQELNWHIVKEKNEAELQIELEGLYREWLHIEESIRKLD